MSDLYIEQSSLIKHLGVKSYLYTKSEMYTGRCGRGR